MATSAHVSRRAFLRWGAAGLGAAGLGAAGLGAAGLGAAGASLFTSGKNIAYAADEAAPAAAGPAGTVALMHGESRADNVLRALKAIEPQVRAKLAGKSRVLIKPNLVLVDRQLAATHAECLEGILEFIKPIAPGEIVIAETAANGATTAAYDNYGYQRLVDKYGVRLVDMDDEEYVVRHVVDEKHRPQPIRFAKCMLAPDTCLISSAQLKTHDRVVVTLGLKSTVFGGVLKDKGYKWSSGSRGTSDKHLVHGGPQNQGIHYNLFQMATWRAPDISVLDGFKGMEHNGPNDGTPVDHRVAIASADWLAADRVGVELMGFDFNKIGYLMFSAQAGLGQADLSRIDVLGEKIADHIRPYQPNDNIEQQYRWLSA